MKIIFNGRHVCTYESYSCTVFSKGDIYSRNKRGKEKKEIYEDIKSDNFSTATDD